MLPTYYSEIKRKYDIKSGDINKLVPNLMPKNLKCYFSQGLILKKST